MHARKVTLLSVVNLPQQLECAREEIERIISVSSYNKWQNIRESLLVYINKWNWYSVFSKFFQFTSTMTLSKIQLNVSIYKYYLPHIIEQRYYSTVYHWKYNNVHKGTDEQNSVSSTQQLRDNNSNKSCYKFHLPFLLVQTGHHFLWLLLLLRNDHPEQRFNLS